MDAFLTELVKQLTPMLLDTLVSLFTLALTTLVGFVSYWVRTKVKDENLQNLMRRLLNATNTTVSGLMQSTVQDLKNAAADGKLTKEEIQQLKQTAINTIMAHLGPQGVEELKSIVGNDLERIIISYIEAEVDKRKMWQ